ncbi:GAF domain-containing protein [Polaromonas sp.]|uniref:GAF domain-containing protein n=1 Tax=Polaromonas sp. TaxID=1869339 RepID=UPI002FC8287D
MNSVTAQQPSLGEIRPCLEGAIPAVMATCAADGTPNVAYISQVFYVDERHVALSFQFFNKTRQNILANPYATVLVLHPVTAAFFRLHIRYLRTETQGPVFEGMKAQLAGIASHSGMAGVFQLLGSDMYEVREIERIDGRPLPEAPARCGMLAALRRSSERLSRCTGLDELLNAALATLTDFLDIRHAMVLMLDPATQRLYTVASCGYATSGVGSEIEMGDGVVGVAARERTPVRIGHMTSAYLYSRAIRSSLRADAPGLALDTDIPYPGLPQPHSQLAVPVLSAGRLLGVLFAESPNDLQFGFEDEDVLVAMAGHLGAAIDLMQDSPELTEPSGEALAQPAAGDPARGAALQLRRFRANDSVFINDAYLIKGVAGAIFWKLVHDYTRHGRTEFSNRELRLDPAIRLPDVTDNLEARLLLLQRRLTEHGPHIRIEKTGRGRFRLTVLRPLELRDVAA